MNISIVIPAYEPDLKSFTKAVESARKTKVNEIIIVDDKTNRKNNKDYFEYLKFLKRDKRIKIHLNKENKGRLANSLYALNLATNDYVKKLNYHDEIVPSEFNKLLEDNIIDEIIDGADMVVTKYYYKFIKENKFNRSKWNIFNGSVIYKKSSLEDINLGEAPNDFYGDINIILSIAEKPSCKIAYSDYRIYKYKRIGTKRPSQLLKNANDWLLGYKWIKKKHYLSYEMNHTIEKQDVIYELIMNKLKIDYHKIKYKHFGFKLFGIMPRWFKRIIAYIVLKF